MRIAATVVLRSSTQAQRSWAALYLASPSSGYTTGEVMVIDGGSMTS